MYKGKIRSHVPLADTARDSEVALWQSKLQWCRIMVFGRSIGITFFLSLSIDAFCMQRCSAVRHPCLADALWWLFDFQEVKI